MKTTTIAACAAVLFLLASPALGADRYTWTKQDTFVQGAFLALVFVDWQQTREFTSDRCKYPTKYETNPLMHNHPTAREVNIVVFGSVVVHTAVAYLLPRPYRTIWQSFWIGVEAEAVYSNFSAGISMRF